MSVFLMFEFQIPTLIFFNFSSRSHLADGEYEVILIEKDLKDVKTSPKKNASWETKPSIEMDEQVDIFDNFPSVKFRLSWTREPAGPLVERPRPLMTRGLNHQQTNSPQLQSSLSNGLDTANNKKDKKSKTHHSKSQNQNPPRIVYQVSKNFSNNLRLFMKNGVYLKNVYSEDLKYVHSKSGNI